MTRPQTFEDAENYLLTCCLKCKVGMVKLETRPDPWTRYELLLDRDFLFIGGPQHGIKVQRAPSQVGRRELRSLKKKILWEFLDCDFGQVLRRNNFCESVVVIEEVELFICFVPSVIYIYLPRV
jgi:hypothetical protein